VKPRTFCYAYGVDGLAKYGKLGEAAWCPSDPTRNVYEDIVSARFQLEHDERKLAKAEGRPPREVFVWPFDTSTDVITQASKSRLDKLGRKA
jgi:hypothetical protein